MRFVFWTLPLLLLRSLFYLAVFITPLVGVWLASSLVAFINGPVLLTVFSGILLFPLIPILWDALRHRRGREPGILTWGDRITLRTLVLNLVFIAALLALRPQTAFLALSTRGDWMLDGHQGPGVEMVRQNLFRAANSLEWLYMAFHRNPYDIYAADTPTLTTETTDQTQPADSSSAQPLETTQPATTTIARPQPGQSADQWPWSGASLHPAVANMPASVETSIESVAQYIAQQEPDSLLRVKALHDYVADRIAYDTDAYFSGQFPPQDAETVFRRHTAVCAGYAKLLEALGRAAGENIIYLVGDSRNRVSDLSGESHAWNAAQINNHWYLIDATWDSGYVDSSGFTKEYKTDYLFPPPQAMAVSHFPEDAVWQLMANPISRGEFLRQPMMRPQFFADGLALVSPTRSQTDINSDVLIQLQNPQQKWLMASYSRKDSNQLERCDQPPAQTTQIACPLPGSGTYEVKLYSGHDRNERFNYVGQLEFNRR